MIQPVSALSPQATFRGSKMSYGSSAREFTNSGVALLNASGIAAAVGGVTTAVSRNYTRSWTHAGVLGLFGAFLALFFMTPQIIEKTGGAKFAKRGEAELEAVSKAKTAQVVEAAKEHLKPAKKLVQFRQS